MMKKLLGGLAVIATLASVVAGRESATIDIVQPALRAAPRLEAALDIDVSRLERRTDEGSGADPFTPRSFAAPQAPAAAAAPEKAGPPPLPFRYLGKMIEDGKLAVFLAQGDESLSVKAGDRIGEYRVDAVTETEVRFTYLPMKTKMSLPL
jgi:hypothetical protein